MIKTINLFPIIDKSLMKLISEMEQADWNRKTNFPNWKVKDIIVHLLDISIRKLSSQRDQYIYQNNVSINSHQELISHITMLADQWTNAFQNVSPAIISELVDKYQKEYIKYIKVLKPFSISQYSVAWAGEKTSFNWFDIAREYTERWHHQMQIREALNKPLLLSKRIYLPVLETFMQALPFHYSKIQNSNYYLVIKV